MPSQKSRRRSRKRRNPGAPPRAVPSRRRELRGEREAVTERSQQRRQSSLGTYGERPPGPFGGVPVSEIAILAGAVGLIVGFVEGSSVALIVGIVVCGLGVIEVTAREHFSGFRSHSALLAAIAAVAVESALIAAVGRPSNRALLLLVIVPVYALVFWILRKRFLTARQARVARPPQA